MQKNDIMCSIFKAIICRGGKNISNMTQDAKLVEYVECIAL